MIKAITTLLMSLVLMETRLLAEARTPLLTRKQGKLIKSNDYRDKTDSNQCYKELSQYPKYNSILQNKNENFIKKTPKYSTNYMNENML